ncbi:MAG: hypothetical protein JW788_03600 [Candidatus Omnitrophica bacterium]|nr:hypothetical protein [Candidatus Omnitrophota bacterium]
MTKLRQFFRSSVKTGLNLCLAAALLTGCNYRPNPTYSRENIESSLEKICKIEYGIDIKAKMAGSTLWIYLPIEDMFIKSDTPQKYTEKFSIDHTNTRFKSGSLKLEYLIRAVPEKEKIQEFKYNKENLEKINKVFRVIHRTLFSFERGEEKEIRFFSLVVADIKNGIETREIFYVQDLKKVAYNFISWLEYQHRTVQDTAMSFAVLGDKEGKYLNCRDITFEEFIADQIEYRIKLKFQKPEVEQDADIDKEILKIVAYTLKSYNFKDFLAVEIANLLTNNLTSYNQAEILSGPF